MNVIATRGLTKEFGDILAVDSLDLEVPQGGVVGFVGPNGSGKSTTIRMLLGLIRPTHGEAEVLGSPVSKAHESAHRIGALIESPSFVPGLSASANLRSLAALRGLSASRVEEVLDVVGLTGRGADLVKGYSMGMKQRLAIAAALLPDPELLILDEPANGLDPAGIVEIRRLLQRLGEEGRTLLVSSHLLSEIEAVCSRVVVIRFGEMLFSGPLTELMERAIAHVDVATEHSEDTVRLLEIYRGQGWETELDTDALIVKVPGDTAPELNRVATQNGITLRTLSAREDTLEDVFLKMTGSTDGDNVLFRSRQKNKKRLGLWRRTRETAKEAS